jgi:RNA polymerase-interacting CarD/CdnL/TRCF family regulator
VELDGSFRHQVYLLCYNIYIYIMEKVYVLYEHSGNEPAQYYEATVVGETKKYLHIKFKDDNKDLMIKKDRIDRVIDGRMGIVSENNMNAALGLISMGSSSTKKKKKRKRKNKTRNKKRKPSRRNGK